MEMFEEQTTVHLKLYNSVWIILHSQNPDDNEGNLLNLCHNLRHHILSCWSINTHELIPFLLLSFHHMYSQFLNT